MYFSNYSMLSYRSLSIDKFHNINGIKDKSPNIYQFILAFKQLMDASGRINTDNAGSAEKLIESIQ